MQDVQEAYSKLTSTLISNSDVSAGQMFGKACVKVGGKAFIALHLDKLAFKLQAPEHAVAMAIEGAHLWDPSGKGRPMKEWVAVPITGKTKFNKLALAAMAYVNASA